MNIIWHGQSCFEVTTTPAKNNQIKIIIDPFSEETGLKITKLEADIVLATHGNFNHSAVKAISGSPFLISAPGEYEIKDVFIQGVPSSDEKKEKEKAENTIYTIEAEDLKVCHLGELSQKELSEEQLEEIGDIDILMVPIGGTFIVSAKEALKIMAQIEPKITIPMYYALPKLKVKLDGLDKFLKSLGIKSVNPESKLTIKKKDISTEEAKIVILKP